METIKRQTGAEYGCLS